jgi:hypothetical protein
MIGAARLRCIGAATSIMVQPALLRPVVYGRVPRLRLSGTGEVVALVVQVASGGSCRFSCRWLGAVNNLVARP